MGDAPLNILFVEDDLDDVRLMSRLLVRSSPQKFKIIAVESAKLALEAVASGPFDLILLDLSLRDSHGLSTFYKIHSEAPDAPIVIFTGRQDEALAAASIREGAQDYLIKGKVTGEGMVRAIDCAIERNRLNLEVRHLALIDPLTGLYNRRGFTALGAQQLKLAARTNTEVSLLFADLDGLKWINDTLGHQEGDRALLETAKTIREISRGTDVAARLGGDEFGLVAIGSGEGIEKIIARLDERIAARNTQEGLRYKLSLSVGSARYDPANPLSFEELLSRADALMYKKKEETRIVRGVSPDARIPASFILA